MSSDISIEQNVINDLNQMSEPKCHFDSSHTTTNCCLYSPDLTVAAEHKLTTSRPALTWSNVGCELEKAKFHEDSHRGQECIDFLKELWVLSNLGFERCTRLADRFYIDFIKERVALQMVLGRIVRREYKGRTTCQYAARAPFKFVEYLDTKTATAPSLVDMIHNSSLLQIMKWAHTNNEIASLGLIEQFLVGDVNEKYFSHHMQLHLANRFNFPFLRMKCLSSLRTPECIEDFQSSLDYFHCLSSIDRSLVEKRAEIFQMYRNADQSIPDEVYHFDLHSDCTFDESIQARYSPTSYNSVVDTSTDESDSGGFGGGGEISVFDFDY